MQLTLQTDYSFRVLLYLAHQDDKGGTIPEISRLYGISENHLRKVVHHLVETGFLKSTRGRGGGLHLNHSPAEISLGAVVRSNEPNFNLVECLGNHPERCVLASDCGLQPIMSEALAAWFAVLDRYTLSDVAIRPTLFASLIDRLGLIGRKDVAAPG